MPRHDLLALTPDDLAELSNRGNVKRAQKDLAGDQVSCTIREGDSGEVSVAWDDGVECCFPGGGTIHDAVCSSGRSGITRHVVRSVLAYQQAAKAERGRDTDDAEQGTPREDAKPHNQRWDPGGFTDEDLVAQFHKTAVNRARKRFEQGVVAELTRGQKPVARFLDTPCVVRFPVPHDLRYATADCAESLWSTWVPLAVWAFREFPVDRVAGLLCLQEAEWSMPADVLTDLDALLDELRRDGLSGVPAPWSHRAHRVEGRLRAEGLVWPAELLADLLHELEMYTGHEAQFDPEQLVLLCGELTARCRAIARKTKSVPQLLVRGSRSDRPTDISGGRLVGLGLGVVPGRRHTTLHAYLQDANSGHVMAVDRVFADPEPDSGTEPRSYSELGGTVLARGVTLASLGSSQVLLKSGKRTPSGRLVLPRSATGYSVNPQAFQWEEQLKPPFMVESFAQLAARFTDLPPSYLRPRRRTENLHAIAVAAVGEANFEPATQRLSAVLRDHDGGIAELVHPYHTRGRTGFEELLAALATRGEQVRFVCGHVSFAGGGTMTIRPICVVMEDGGRRSAIQPWVDPGAGGDGQASEAPADLGLGEHSLPPLDAFLGELLEALTDVLMTGLPQADAIAWQDLDRFARQLGFARLAEPIRALADALYARQQTVRWDPASASSLVRELCLLARMLGE